MEARLDSADPDPRMAYELPGAGHALFTSRVDGNISSVGGLGHGHGSQVRERLRAQLGLRHLARGYQVHGTTVLRIRADADIPAQDSATAQPPVHADGHATATAGIGVMALAADCLPVALGANGAVAMVHAGWRGLATGVLEEGVRAVRELGEGNMNSAGEDDERIVAIIGPGAGPCCYEVGEEVHAAFGWLHRTDCPPTRTPPTRTPPTRTPPTRTPPTRTPPSRTPPTRTPPSRNIDLKAIARDRLLAAGVAEVQDIAVCTICDERFFSYRREGARAGRQGGVAWLS